MYNAFCIKEKTLKKSRRILWLRWTVREVSTLACSQPFSSCLWLLVWKALSREVSDAAHPTTKACYCSFTNLVVPSKLWKKETHLTKLRHYCSLFLHHKTLRQNNARWQRLPTWH